MDPLTFSIVSVVNFRRVGANTSIEPAASVSYTAARIYLEPTVQEAVYSCHRMVLKKAVYHLNIALGSYS